MGDGERHCFSAYWPWWSIPCNLLLFWSQDLIGAVPYRIACTVPGELKMFRLHVSAGSDSVRVQKVASSLLPHELSKSVSGAIAFSANSQQLIVGAVSGQIDVVRAREVYRKPFAQPCFQRCGSLVCCVFWALAGFAQL